MLTLKLDELVPPELVLAFQRQWADDEEVALAQSSDALRLLTAPRDDAERSLAKLILTLVGPEPDAFVWLQAIAGGKVKLSEAVTTDITRVKQSPAQAIFRQRQRIASLVISKKQVDDRAVVENAYRDALRLLIAVSLLDRLREAVERKAAFGASWAAMAAITDHCSLEEKRVLYWLGDDKDFQAALGAAINEVVKTYPCVIPPSNTPTKGDLERGLPPRVNPYAFFEQKAATIAVKIQKRGGSIIVPGFLKEPSKDEMHVARERCQFLMPSLSGHQAHSPDGVDQARVAQNFALALRAEERRKERFRYEKSGDSRLNWEVWNLQSAIFQYAEDGKFFPAFLPTEYVGYLEEDIAWHYQRFGKSWKGYKVWRSKGYMIFKPSALKTEKISYGVEIYRNAATKADTATGAP